MKKRYFAILFMMVVLVLGLTGCEKSISCGEQEENGQEYFNAKVLEVYDSFVSVECLEVTTGAVNEGANVHVSKKVASTNEVPDMKVGDEIRVVFTGVLETYPLQLQTVWAIYVLDEDGNVVVIENSAISDSERDTESNAGNSTGSNGASCAELELIEVSTENTKSFDKYNWGISLSVKDVTTSGLILICTQSGGTPTGDLQTGSEYKLLVSEKGVWKEVPTRLKEYGWDAVAYMIPKNDSREFEINWEWLYGELPEGTYRITKEIMDFRGSGDYDEEMYYAEFEVE